MLDIVYRMSDIVYWTSDMILDVGYSISEGVIMEQPTQNKKRKTDETDNVILTHLAPHSNFLNYAYNATHISDARIYIIYIIYLLLYIFNSWKEIIGMALQVIINRQCAI